MYDHRIAVELACFVFIYSYYFFVNLRWSVFSKVVITLACLCFYFLFLFCLKIVVILTSVAFIFNHFLFSKLSQLCRSHASRCNSSIVGHETCGVVYLCSSLRLYYSKSALIASAGFTVRVEGAGGWRFALNFYRGLLMPLIDREPTLQQTSTINSPATFFFFDSHSLRMTREFLSLPHYPLPVPLLRI